MPNGCGSKDMAPLLNSLLSFTNQSDVIPCCNEHDICYFKCHYKKECDLEFRDCLKSQCSKQNWFARILCNALSQTIYTYIDKEENDLKSNYWCTN